MTNPIQALRDAGEAAAVCRGDVADHVLVRGGVCQCPQEDEGGRLMDAGKLTRPQVIALLKKLEKGWPDSLWLFAASGSMCLMEYGEDGERVVCGQSMSADAIVEYFNGIKCDGGDW